MPDYDEPPGMAGRVLTLHFSIGTIRLTCDPDQGLRNLEAHAKTANMRRRDDFDRWLQQEAQQVLTEHFTRLANTPPEV